MPSAAAGRRTHIEARARYRYEIVRGRRCEVVCVEDLYGVDGPGSAIVPTVTNDVDAVVRALARNPGIVGRTIIYRDTLGGWDQILHDGEAFCGFAAIGVYTREEALTVVNRVEAPGVPALVEDTSRHVDKSTKAAARVVLDTPGMIAKLAEVTLDCFPASKVPKDQLEARIRVEVMRIAEGGRG